jgi:exonuclease SbcC
VDEVLQEQRQTLTQTETERDSANTRLQLLLQRKTAADTSVDAAKAALEQMKSEKQQAAFSVARWMQNFETETGLTLNEQSLQRELAVPAEVLEAEQRRLQTLRDAVTRSETQLETCRKIIKKHRETPAPENDSSQLQQLLQEQESLLRDCDEKLRTAEFLLRQDDELRRIHAAVAKQLEDYEATAGPWLKLNELIGSADGKKFSLLAQQVTLDLLLQHANLQLRELASRYRLERLDESLNLSVVDQDLGDEPRSVHSLSGGETFLASLALALGLASLTSSRVRIESLFIDEGFGSLDEETLEVAMNALAHLQSQGRRVGIITHVERMKDAIPVQIRIQRTAGGASRIVLPRSQSSDDST